MRDAITPKLKLAAKIFYVHSFVKSLSLPLTYHLSVSWVVSHSRGIWGVRLI